MSLTPQSMSLLLDCWRDLCKLMCVRYCNMCDLRKMTVEMDVDKVAMIL